MESIRVRSRHREKKNSPQKGEIQWSRTFTILALGRKSGIKVTDPSANEIEVGNLSSQYFIELL